MEKCICVILSLFLLLTMPAAAALAEVAPVNTTPPDSLGAKDAKTDAAAPAESVASIYDFAITLKTGLSGKEKNLRAPVSVCRACEGRLEIAGGSRRPGNGRY